MKTCMQRPWMMLVRLEINCNKYPMCDVLWSDLKRTPDVVGQTLSTRYHYNQSIIFEVSNKNNNKLIFAEVCPLSSSLLLQERS